MAVDLVTHGMPSLRLFGNHKAADGSDVYELFADIFTVLQVRSAAAEFLVKHRQLRAPGLLAPYTLLVLRNILPQRNPAAFNLHYLHIGA